MPLISGFKSTNIWKAFILNSIMSSLVIIIALTVKSNFDTFSNNKDINKDTNNIKQRTNFKSILLTIVATFISYMIAYSIMYFLFGYGDGMVVNN
jgi:ABC-type spermidine/putrescine transport system permease subunit I